LAKFGVLAIVLILVLIQLQFRNLVTTLIIGSGILVAMAGGFIMIWLYNQPWFLDVRIGDFDLRATLNITAVNWSVAVGVGFLALFGIATDDGVLMSTYIRQRLAAHPPDNKQALRDEIAAAALRRIRPAMMTTATTLIALLPVLTSTGRGSDIMVPMAIPTFGGMALAIFTVLVVPTLTYWKECRRFTRKIGKYQG
jgi:Cu(I)/Ag(I) efflux system membrane protein CusA/SilA